MALWDSLADLEIRVDGYSLHRRESQTPSGWTRVTTTVALSGAGTDGLGEDVTYDAAMHDGVPEELMLAGTWSLEDFSRRLDEFEELTEGYRRWAFESAALDLALRQAGRSLAEALGREPRPVRFVVSKRIDSLDKLGRLLDRYPGTRLKLDPTSEWTEEFVDAVAASGAVDVVDLKGAYHGTPVDQPPDPALYERVASGFPEAWIEDPALTPETDRILEPFRDRITWDAPIHSVADVEALPFPPQTLNVKPSRFGPLRELFAFYDHCAAREIGLYGGGQFELGPGRGQIQVLASLFNPDAPNDVAPSGYNETEPPEGLEVSPLEPALAPTGFRRARP